MKTKAEIENAKIEETAGVCCFRLAAFRLPLFLE
jgi:hypothetical protein